MGLLVSFHANGNQDPRIVHARWRDEEAGPIREPDWTNGVSMFPRTMPEPFDIKRFFVEKRQPEKSGFDLSVASPSHLYSWLQSNDATQLSRLSIFSHAADVGSDEGPDDQFNSWNKDLNRTSEWKRLFEWLATDGVAPNLTRLKMYWDFNNS